MDVEAKKWKDLGMLFQKSQIINSGSHKIQFVGSSLLHVKETHIKELGFKKDDFSELHTSS